MCPVLDTSGLGHTVEQPISKKQYQFEVKSDELQPRDKCKKQSEMIMTANQSVSVKEETTKIR